MKRAAAKRNVSVLSVARNLALVLALCLALRLTLDAAEGAAALPDSLGAGILAATLPGAEGEKRDLGVLTLAAALPGGFSMLTASAEAPDVSRREASGNTKRASGDGSKTAVGTAPEGDGEGASEGEFLPDTSNLPPDETPVTPPSDPHSDPVSPPSDTPSDPISTPSETPLNDAIGTTITGRGSGYSSWGDIYYKNRTKYDIDVEKYLNEPLKLSASDGAAVLIIHTHGSEAYNPAGEDIYVPSDPSRTEDKSFNVVRVGDELEKVLTERGIRVVHDRELYDYPSYTGSYNRSLESIERHLKEDPDIKVVIDLHRDALEGDGKLYKTVADVGDTPSAQVMLICGSNSSGLNHPNWEENLTFALRIQSAMVEKYPTLARPLKISEYRYNQHATTGSLIAEIGTNGNTLKEALAAVRYFGDCLADVLEGE